MSQATSVQIEVDALTEEYKKYIQGLRQPWLDQNRMNSKDVYEVMRPQERAEVHRRMEQWDHYITPLAEAWWGQRGYGVVWPSDNLKPMKVHKL